MSVKKLFYLFCVGLNQLIALIIFFFSGFRRKKDTHKQNKVVKIFLFYWLCEYESDLCSNEHYLSSSENKA